MSIIDYGDGISKDTNVLGNNVYFGNGQGCGTIWFKDVANARKFIEKKGRISGRDFGLCEKCSCHYSFGTPEHSKYPEFACHKWKEQRAKT